MELLAPAGNFENFRAALEAGADAVYVGAPGLNARNLARDLRLDEIGAMVRSAHDGGRKLYVAVNSLVREVDLPKLLETLAYLEAVSPDALIVQDLGIINLVTRHFPSLRLHASTLMTAHNLDSINLLGALGCSRVVVARELTIKEITALIRATDVEIEVFIHGAMCFSYSGLCMFSSYLGGKSGLRGKCVQPCRRKFSIAGGGKSGKTKAGSGYLFSMNDLSGLEMVPKFLQMGVASLKIEGRLRSATYVRSIVTAYRQMITAGPEHGDEAIREASALVNEAMGRRTSSGYFLTPQPKDAIVQHHSGNIGDHLGRISSIEQQKGELIAYITLKKPCEVGERLRLHLERTGERLAFTLEKIIDHQLFIEKAPSNKRVGLVLPGKIKASSVAGQVEVYRVDVKRRLGANVADSWNRPEVRGLSKKQSDSIKIKADRITRMILPEEKDAPGKQPISRKGRKVKGASATELWLRLDSPRLVLGKLPFTPDRYVLNLAKNMMSNVGQIKNYLGRTMRSVIWALPMVVHDSAMRQLEKNIRILIKSGFRTFQVAHLSQVELFGGERVQLYGDYSLNLMNSQAMRKVASLDFRGFQLAIEMDRSCLNQAIRGYRQEIFQSAKDAPFDRSQLGLTVYGAPALFTSRIAADYFSYGRTLVSPKDEMFYIEKKEGYTQTRPRRQFSLLPYRRELEAAGLNYLVVDLTGMKIGKRELKEVADRVSGKAKLFKLPTFNYLGTLE